MSPLLLARVHDRAVLNAERARRRGKGRSRASARRASKRERMDLVMGLLYSLRTFNDEVQTILKDRNGSAP